MTDVILDLSKEEAERIVNDKDYQKKFIAEQTGRLQDARGNQKYLLFCPYCGKETLEGYSDRPFFFACTECNEAIFMTSKKNFEDMNKELEEVYKKEKSEAIKEALESASLNGEKNNG